MSEHKSIFKSAAVISAMVVLSRITGFIRDVLIAGIFGTGPAAQAFFVAYRIPNMFRDLVGEGAANAAFVPVFCEYLVSKSRQQFQKLVTGLFLIVTLAAVVLTLIGMLLASPLVKLIAPGFLADPEKLSLSIHLTRIIFPYLILAAISAFLMALSNSLKSFALPASSSAVFNVATIVLLVLCVRHAGSSAIYILGWSVLLSGLCQVLVQIPVFRHHRISFQKDAWTPQGLRQEGIGKVGRLIVPRLLGTSIYQLNLFVDTIFASLAFFVGDGAIAAIYYANRIIQFPFGVIGLSLSNAALPQMSQAASCHDMEKLNKAVAFCLRGLFIVMLPVMIGILVFAAPLVQVIFQRGSFNAYSTSITAVAVFFYGLGLLSYSGVRFLSHAFYALQDTMTPVKTAGTALISTVLLSSLFVFVFRFRLAGLALASSLSASLNFYLLYRRLKVRTGFGMAIFEEAGIKVLAAAAGSVVLAFFVWQGRFSPQPSFIGLCLVILLAAVTYGALLWLLGVREARELFQWLIKRK